MKSGDPWKKMLYSNVCIESFGYTLPAEVVSSSEIESRLAPVYQRLRLPEGRLEAMTGIAERRFWTAGTLPSENSILSSQKALRATEMDRGQVGALIHASVCRDHLEPATASRVHHQLGLRRNCLIYDVSNACLGLLNGIIQVANMIELRQIRAGLVVGSEGGRELVENTIARLNHDTSLTRSQIKLSIASLTIGSASCAVLLTDRKLSQTGNRLVAAVADANTQHHRLCHSGQDSAVGEGMMPWMQTDSEKLMQEGIATGVETLQHFLATTEWRPEDIDKTFCHQVGIAHHKLMFDALNLDPRIDFTTFPWLGNTGSVALPITMALGQEQGHLEKGNRVGLFGIGSGINCVMLAVDWQSG